MRAAHGPELAARVERAVAPFGGWGAIVKPGERIAVKVNLLRAAAPEQAVTTHPETLRCVLQRAQAGRGAPVRGRQPGRPQPGRQGGPRLAGDRPGRRLLPPRASQLVDVDSDPAELHCPDGRLFRSLPVGRAFLEADGIVQVGPLKTHVLMRLTGAVKLTFGCVPGLAKAGLHVRASKREDFADMLLDLHLGLRPRFSIIDGIIAMEGQGPGGGTPRELGSLFAAADALALDAALADRTAHRREDIYVLAAGARRGLIDLKHPYELAATRSSRPPTSCRRSEAPTACCPAASAAWRAGSWPAGRAWRDPQACTQCGDCESICGARAIRLAPAPVFDDDACVRCYACAEVCPSGALDVVTPAMARFLGGCAAQAAQRGRGRRQRLPGRSAAGADEADDGRLRPAEEAERQQAGADAAGDVDEAAVAVVDTVLERRPRLAEHHRAAEPRQADLAAVGVAAQRQVERAGRRLQRALRVVAEEQAQGVRVGGRARASTGRRSPNPCFTSSTPQICTRRGAAPHRHRLVGEQAHAVVAQVAEVDGAGERRLAAAVVVVAEHREDAQRCVERAEQRLDAVEVGGAAGKVAGDGDEVRLRRHGQIEGDARGAHVEAGPKAGVRVGEVGDGEAVQIRSAGRPRRTVNSTRRTHWASKTM